MRMAVAVIVSAVLGAGAFALIGVPATADSASSYYDRQIVNELNDIERELDAIKYNTGAVCEEAKTGYLCKKF